MEGRSGQKNPLVAVKAHICHEQGIKSVRGRLLLAAKASEFKGYKLKAA